MIKRILLLIIFLLIIPFALADIGPKPTAEIHVTFEGQPIEEPFDAALLICNGEKEWKPFNDCFGEEECNKIINFKDDECSWGVAQFAWNRGCKESTCNFNYMIPTEFKVLYLIDDKLYISEKMKRENFNSIFESEINGETVTIKDKSPFITKSQIRGFIPALILTLIIELLVALIFRKYHNLRWSIIGWVFLLNLISLPIVWFLIGGAIKNFILMILVAEIFAFLFEAYGLKVLGKLPKKKALIMSLAMNLLSFMFGGIILFFMMLMGRI